LKAAHDAVQSLLHRRWNTYPFLAKVSKMFFKLIMQKRVNGIILRGFETGYIILSYDPNLIKKTGQISLKRVHIVCLSDIRGSWGFQAVSSEL
jgi:hypothetical protein